MRSKYGPVRFMLMNSFSTSKDTMDFLSKGYPTLVAEGGIEFVQNKVPKLDATTFEPATDPANPSNEWCPPGESERVVKLRRH